MPVKFTIEEVYKRCPDMAPGQKWKGNDKKYRFVCSKGHEDYWQIYGLHTHKTRPASCPECWHILKSKVPPIRSFPKELEDSLRASGIKPNFKFLKVSIIYAPNSPTVSKQTRG